MRFDQYQDFLRQWFAAIDKLGIDTAGLRLDHMGFSTASADEYEHYKQELRQVGRLVREIEISNRRVGVFELFEPLRYKDHEISAVELMEPVAGEKIKAGWEHAELTIPYPFEQFMDKYPQVTWDAKNIYRPDFPRLKVVLSEGMELKLNQTPILAQ